MIKEEILCRLRAFLLIKISKSKVIQIINSNIKEMSKFVKFCFRSLKVE